ncbi:hypothetical protein [Streptomyces pseudovenezuelae]|uniref:hypothetical protein n=1 Tax=Streptomyces pseudovenezuelae TaxID=67350 RepID=UPI00371AF2BA
MPADPPGDQASNSALQRLGQAIRDLHAAAGRPSLRMVSQRVKEGGHPGTASHTTVGAILKGTKPVSWEALAAVVTELMRTRELQAAPTEDEDPKAGETARLQAEMQACSRVRTLWLEVECHKDDGASESTKAARSFAWELHRLIVEPLGGDLARISRAIRALRVNEATPSGCGAPRRLCTTCSYTTRTS